MAEQPPSLPITDWQSALDYLYERPNWEAAPPSAEPGFKLGRIRSLLAGLGDPQLAWPAVHVGGTNGKGSTCALIAGVLQAAGYRVGLFTSPHMHTVRERIQVNREPISEAAVMAWLNAHGKRLEHHAGLTTFEALTAMAFSHFAAANVDIAVVEVGLGGRMDSTNVLQSRVTVLTPIDLDHTEVLGTTHAAIAADKTGIFRPGVPAVSAPQHPEAMAVIERAAADLGAPLTVVGRDVHVKLDRLTADGQRLVVTFERDRATDREPAFDIGLDGDHEPAFDFNLDPDREPAFDTGVAADHELAFEIGLVGAHQRTNAAVAVAALAALVDQGWPIARRAVLEGMRAAAWPGRFERLNAPGDTGPVVLVDGAHNPHAAAVLAQALGDHYPAAPRILVLGFTKGKDTGGILDALCPGTLSVVATQADHPKAWPAEAVADLVHTHCPDLPVLTAANPARAIAAALAAAVPGSVVVATGSIFVAGDVREAYCGLIGRPLPPRDPPRPVGAGAP